MNRTMNRSLYVIAALTTVLWCKPLCAHGSQETIYGGKSVDVWVSDLNAKKPQAVRDQAKEAISQMGTNALPFLMEELDSFEKVAITNYYTPEMEARRSNLNAAFAALGSAAKPAVPALTDLMNRGGNAACSAARALTEIGPVGVAPLAEALTNATLAVRICIAQVISEAGTNACTAVPELLQCLKSQSVELRDFATASLGSIRCDPQEVVPVLVTKLSDENAGVRFSAARALGKFGESAKAAVPALRKALGDSDKHVRGEAAVALKQIQP